MRGAVEDCATRSPRDRGAAWAVSRSARRQLGRPELLPPGRGCRLAASHIGARWSAGLPLPIAPLPPANATFESGPCFRPGSLRRVRWDASSAGLPAFSAEAGDAWRRAGWALCFLRSGRLGPTSSSHRYGAHGGPAGPKAEAAVHRCAALPRVGWALENLHSDRTDRSSSLSRSKTCRAILAAGPRASRSLRKAGSQPEICSPVRPAMPRRGEAPGPRRGEGRER
jgi:hypothetical protein